MEALKFEISEEERDLRKRFGLPSGKQLQYLKSSGGKYQKFNVAKVEPGEAYPSGWNMLRVTLENGNVVKIHSSYFADMQKSSFEKE